MIQDDRFEFDCNICSVRIRAKRRVSGLTRQCPKCGNAIVVPAPSPQPYVPPQTDPDAARSLHLLAVRAAALVQHVLSENREVALLINGVFVYLPREHELDTIPNAWNDELDAAWSICQEVSNTIERYGNHHRQVWIDTLQAMQVVDDSRPSRPTPNTRRRWSIAVRRAVWQRFGRRCIHCGIHLETWQGHNMHLDHLKPLCEDGDDDESNLVPSCPDCNLEKGGRLFPELNNTTKRP